MNVHQLRVTPCPVEFPAGYYWYGQRQHSPGKTPQWLEKLSEDGSELELSNEDVHDGRCLRVLPRC